MKKIIFCLVLCFQSAFPYCFALWDFTPTCGTVNETMSIAISTALSNFTTLRENQILKPTEKLDEKLIHYNQINGEIYKEQKSITILDNEMLRKVAEQKDLLQQLSELKAVSSELNILITKQGFNDTNASK